MRAARSTLWLFAVLIMMPLAAWAQPASSGSGLLNAIELLDIRTRRVIPMGAINSSTVEGFEVLYATPGSGDVSEVAGHLLLRIKLKDNPDAHAAGIDNPYDLVLSFLADTERGQPAAPSRPLVIHEHCRKRNWLNLAAPRSEAEAPWQSIWQSLKGLAGGFFIVMDRQTLEQAIKHYTVEQDRNLHRYALILSAEQKADLVNHLHAITASYRQRYYFFSMNCGSALVRVLGEGVGDKVVAAFDPLVSPPHSLVALLVRRGLAERVYPSFHSSTTKGYIARRIFVESYSTMMRDDPGAVWPSIRDLFDADEATRARAVQALFHQVDHQDTAMSYRLFRLGALVQEAEMVFDNKRDACEDYTSEATAAARHLQAAILEAAADAPSFRVSMDQELSAHFRPVERMNAETGCLYTGLQRWRLGGGAVDCEGEGAGVFSLSLSLLEQEMGSPSRLAMQRGGSLTLGHFGFTSDGTDVVAWRVTGLQMRKFRDTLDRVESGLFSTRGLGLGLRVLAVNHEDDVNSTRGTLFGAEVLLNVASSARHANYLFVFAGAHGDYVRYEEHDNFTLTPEFGLEGLVTLDPAMRWQWRSTVACSLATRDENSDVTRLRSSLTYRLGEVGAMEATLGFSVAYQRTERSDLLMESHEQRMVRLELILDRW